MCRQEIAAATPAAAAGWSGWSDSHSRNLSITSLQHTLLRTLQQILLRALLGNLPAVTLNDPA